MSRRSTRQPRRVTVDLAELIAAHPELRKHDEMWSGQGYAVASARLFRCKDGTFTARIVWRQRVGVVLTSISYVARGFQLA